MIKPCLVETVAKRRRRSMMVELFVLGCTGVVLFLHGANFFFHVLTHHVAIRSLSFFGSVGW
ncbi:hypothetical protein ACB092_01G236200 [Castanea dentata]